jgi:hypothetical protein
MKTIQQLAHENKDKLQGMEGLLGYKFADLVLLQRAPCFLIGIQA